LVFNGTHQFVVCADYISLLGENINNIWRNTGNLSDVSEAVGIEVQKSKGKIVAVLK
jgi:hypothetical protein